MNGIQRVWKYAAGGAVAVALALAVSMTSAHADGLRVSLQFGDPGYYGYSHGTYGDRQYPHRRFRKQRELRGGRDGWNGDRSFDRNRGFDGDRNGSDQRWNDGGRRSHDRNRNRDGSRGGDGSWNQGGWDGRSNS
ncbi:MAG TPA: hypothetical protein VFK69_04395 [Candidatus Eisenbacteria bacterium]|nr:hypothetical protein [Candidatus Eisenbacteria bacterium]